MDVVDRGRRAGARAAAWLAVGLIGCGPKVDVVAEGESTGAADSTGSVQTTATPADSTGLPPSTTLGTSGGEPSPPSTESTDGAADESTGPGTTGASATTTGGLELIECEIGGDDCPPGFKCQPHYEGPFVGLDNWCVEVVEEPVGVGEACEELDDVALDEAYDDCDAELICFPGQMGNPTCSVLCGHDDQNQDLCGEDEYCTLYSSDVAICSLTCDPLLQDCPDEGEGCYYSPTFNQSICAPTVGGKEKGGLGEDCDNLNSCDPGLACVSGKLAGCEDNGCCVPYCDLSQPDVCDKALPGNTCQPLLPVDGDPMDPDLGVCLLPPE